MSIQAEAAPEPNLTAGTNGLTVTAFYVIISNV